MMSVAQASRSSTGSLVGRERLADDHAHVVLVAELIRADERPRLARVEQVVADRAREEEVVRLVAGSPRIGIDLDLMKRLVAGVPDIGSDRGLLRGATRSGHVWVTSMVATAVPRAKAAAVSKAVARATAPTIRVFQRIIRPRTPLRSVDDSQVVQRSADDAKRPAVARRLPEALSSRDRWPCSHRCRRSPTSSGALSPSRRHVRARLRRLRSDPDRRARRRRRQPRGRTGLRARRRRHGLGAQSHLRRALQPGRHARVPDHAAPVSVLAVAYWLVQFAGAALAALLLRWIYPETQEATLGAPALASSIESPAASWSKPSSLSSSSGSRPRRSPSARLLHGSRRAGGRLRGRLRHAGGRPAHRCGAESGARFRPRARRERLG